MVRPSALADPGESAEPAPGAQPKLSSVTLRGAEPAPHIRRQSRCIDECFPFGEAKNIEFRAEFFNLFRQVNFANPISNLNAIPSSGINPNTGHIINPGDFGHIVSTSNNPRLIQFALKFNY